MQFSTPLPSSKRLKIFKNGDESFGGKHVVVSEKLVKSWDIFLADITRQLNSRVAIKSLHSPVNGTEVNCFEELVDKMDYVAVGTGTFKKIGYSYLKEKQPLKFSVSQKTPQVSDVFRKKLDVPGKIRDVKTGSLTLFVYTNGSPLTSPVRINIPMKCADKWESVISEIDEKFKLRGRDARSLFTLDGEELKYVDQLEQRGHYVAVGCGTKGFIGANYGEAKPAFYVPLNKHARRYSKVNTQTEKWRRTSNPGLSNSIPHSGIKTDEFLKKSLLSTFGSNESFYSKSHRRGNVKQTNYDDDSGGRFRLKKQSIESLDAQEVQENQSTKEEIPIEKRPTECILEDIENGEEFCDKNFQNRKHSHKRNQTNHRENIKSEKPKFPENRDRGRVELTYRKYS